MSVRTMFCAISAYSPLTYPIAIQIREPTVNTTNAHPIKRARARAAKTSPAHIVTTDAIHRRTSGVAPLLLSAIPG
jgi:hypothetical protein